MKKKKMPITEKEFKKIIDSIKNIDKHINNLIKFGFDINSKLINDLMCIETEITNYLDTIFHSKDDIDWFVFENDFGSKNFNITFTKPEKKEFKISNEHDMYKYLEYCIKKRG